MQVKITAICLLLSIWYSHREKPAFLLPCLVPASVKEEGSCLTWYGLPYTRGLEKQSPGKKVPMPVGNARTAKEVILFWSCH